MTDQAFLTRFENTKQKIAALILQDLGADVPAHSFNRDMEIIMEAIDELAYEPVREAKRVIAQESREDYEQVLRHQHLERTYA